MSLIRGGVSLIRGDVSLIRGDISLIRGNFSLIRGCRLFGAMRLFPPLIQHIRSYSSHAICVYIYIYMYICVYTHAHHTLLKDLSMFPSTPFRKPFIYFTLFSLCWVMPAIPNIYLPLSLSLSLYLSRSIHCLINNRDIFGM